jgi:hypothetical protein
MFLNFYSSWQEGEFGGFLILIFPSKYFSFEGEELGDYPISMFKCIIQKNNSPLNKEENWATQLLSQGNIFHCKRKGKVAS